MKSNKQQINESLRPECLEGKDINFKKMKEKKVYYIETDPRIFPQVNQSGIEIVTVKHGYGFRWLRCEGSWCWFPPNMHGPEGNSPCSENNFNPIAMGGALVAYCGRVGNTNYYIDYEKRFDISQGGTTYYKNDLGIDWELKFCINDVLNDWVNNYKDNLGYMNSDIEVFRL